MSERDLLRVEVGERAAFDLLNPWGENKPGDGYAYHRRVVVIYRARDAKRFPVGGQMGLFEAVA